RFRMALTASFAAESSRSWATDLHASESILWTTFLVPGGPNRLMRK
ncbi:hypothetical protein Tco_0050997, partial [Tanacetum coccineum]